MRRRRHCCQPRADVGHGVGRAAVAGAGGDEHIGQRGAVKSLLDGVGNRGLRSADRKIDDVDAVFDGLVDRLDGIRIETRVGGIAAVGGGAVVIGPANLVGRDARAWRDARRLAHRHAIDDDGDSAVAGRGRGGVIAVAATAAAGAVRADVRVARRIELAPVLAQTGGKETGIEIFGADQLVVAMLDRIESFAGHATADKRRWRADVGQARGRVEGWRTAGVDAVRKRSTFRPDAAVDNADDHVFALDERTAGKLRPQATRRAQLEKGRGRHGVEMTGQIGLHIGDGRIVFQQQHFGVGQQGGKAVEHNVIGGDHGGVGDRDEHVVLAIAQIAHIILHVTGAVVEGDAGGRLGGRERTDAASVACAGWSCSCTM